MNIAVLDIGKTNIKFAVFGAAGDVKFEHQIPNVVLPGPPYPHVDVEKIWAFLGASLREASKSLDIHTLVPTTHGATGAVMTGDGLVLPIMDYEFAGLQAIAEPYGKLRDEFNKTFSPDMSFGLNWGRQLAWQKWHNGAAFEKATAIVAYPQYWVWRLTGKFANDLCSLGCHTDLWLPLENRPSGLAEALGVAALLSPIEPPWQNMGNIQPKVADAFGLKYDIKVLCGIHDSNASLLPYLSENENPLTILSTGTWAVAMALGHSLSGLRRDMDMNANIDAVGRATACARFMGGREFAVIAGDCSDEPSMKGIQRLIRDRVIALPSFSPSGGPYSKHKGEIIGECAAKDRSNLATLYCALMCNVILNNLDALHGDIIVKGNFAHNSALTGILAQMRPRQRIFVSVAQNSTAHCAALLEQWPLKNTTPDLSLIQPAKIDQLDKYHAQWMELITKTHPPVN